MNFLVSARLQKTLMSCKSQSQEAKSVKVAGCPRVLNVSLIGIALILFSIPTLISGQVPAEGLRSRLELIDARNPAATFKVRLQSATGQTTFKVGEKTVFELQSDIDAYAIVLTRDASGAIVQLWPNEWSVAAHLKKGVSTLLPSGPDAGFKIEAQPPVGLTIIKVIASRHQLTIDGAAGGGLSEIPEGSKGFALIADAKIPPRRPSELAPDEWATAELLVVVTDKNNPTPFPLPPKMDSDRHHPIKADGTANERYWQSWIRIGRDLRAGKLDTEGAGELGQTPVLSQSEVKPPSPTEIIVVRRNGAKGAPGGYRREVVPVAPVGAKGFDRGDLLAQIEKIRKEPDVITAYPNGTIDKQQSGGVKLWSLHYHLTNEFAPGIDIGWTKLPPEARRVRTPFIGVVDEGPDLTDPRIAGIFAKNLGEIPGNNIDDDGNGFIDDVIGWNFLRNSPELSDSPRTGQFNHGSFVCSIIAGRPVGMARDVQGIAPSAQIVPAAVFDGDRKPSDTDIIRAIEYCTNRGARVINMSLGRPIKPVDLVAESADPAWAGFQAAGVVLVCAAGNDGVDTDVTPFFPAGLTRFYPNVISVMATDVGGDRGKSRKSQDDWSYFSNFGAQSVTLAAPGTCIPGVPEPNKIGINNGTSFAAPQVTAAVAIIMGIHPDWNYEKVIRALVQTSTPLEALSGECVSGGIINLPAAVAFNPDAPSGN